MQTKKVSFEEVYDVFAIRIILDTDEANEKAEHLANVQHGHGFLPAERTVCAIGSAYPRPMATSLCTPP